MNGTLVSIGLTTAVKLPQVVILPQRISNGLGVERRYVLSGRQQEVPASLRDWMLDDRRYKDWFDADPEPKAQVKAVPKPAVKAVEEVEEEDGKQQDADVDGDLWSEHSPLAVLRAYAAAYDITFPFGVTKASAVDLLREKLPEREQK